MSSYKTLFTYKHFVSRTTDAEEQELQQLQEEEDEAHRLRVADIRKIAEAAPAPAPAPALDPMDVVEEVKEAEQEEEKAQSLQQGKEGVDARGYEDDGTSDSEGFNSSDLDEEIEIGAHPLTPRTPAERKASRLERKRKQREELGIASANDPPVDVTLEEDEQQQEKEEDAIVLNAALAVAIIDDARAEEAAEVPVKHLYKAFHVPYRDKPGESVDIRTLNAIGLAYNLELLGISKELSKNRAERIAQAAANAKVLATANNAMVASALPQRVGGEELRREEIKPGLAAAFLFEDEKNKNKFCVRIGMIQKMMNKVGTTTRRVLWTQPVALEAVPPTLSLAIAWLVLLDEKKNKTKYVYDESQKMKPECLAKFVFLCPRMKLLDSGGDVPIWELCASDLKHIEEYLNSTTKVVVALEKEKRSKRKKRGAARAQEETDTDDEKEDKQHKRKGSTSVDEKSKKKKKDKKGGGGGGAAPMDLVVEGKRKRGVGIVAVIERDDKEADKLIDATTTSTKQRRKNSV